MDWRIRKTKNKQNNLKYNDRWHGHHPGCNNGIASVSEYNVNFPAL